MLVAGSGEDDSAHDVLGLHARQDIGDVVRGILLHPDNAKIASATCLHEIGVAEV